MKRLIVKAGLFLIGLTILVQLFGFVISETLEQIYLQKTEVGWLGSQKVNPSVVFLGASTIRYGISPTIITNRTGLGPGEVINLAYDARTPPMSLRVLKDLLALHSKVRLVFYSIEPWVLSEKYYQYDDFESLHWSILQKTFATLMPIAFPNDPKERLIPKNHFLNLERVLTTIISNLGRRHLANDDPPEDFGGASQRPGNLDDSAQSEEVCRWYSPKSLFNVSEFHFKRLSELKSLAEHAGARFVIILPPLSKLFWADYERNCSTADAQLTEAIRKYLGPVAVVGSFKLFQASRDSIHFADWAHLNAVGQKRFSLFIADQLRAASFRAEPIKSLIRY